MPSVTKFPTANELEVTGWTNPNNAQAADGVYATCAPGKNLTVFSRWLTFGFDSAIPSGAAISAVNLIYQYKVDTQASIATARVRAVIAGVNQADKNDTTEPLADTIITANATADRAWTRNDLLNANFKVSLGGVRGNSNNAVTFSLDYVQVQVDYTDPSIGTSLLLCGAGRTGG